jgi:hypothetical protein
MLFLPCLRYATLRRNYVLIRSVRSRANNPEQDSGVALSSPTGTGIICCASNLAYQTLVMWAARCESKLHSVKKAGRASLHGTRP